MPRECHIVTLMVMKRGRGRGFFGFITGNPWAERRLELSISYTSAILEYYKGEDNLRDRIDLMGSSTEQMQDGSSIIGSRNNGIEITLASQEKIYLACHTPEDQTRILKAMKYAGDAISSVDSLAEKLNLNVLMKDHEKNIYDYIDFKGTKLNGGLNQDFNPMQPGVITMSQLNDWEIMIEKTFLCLYKNNSEEANVEEYHQQEFKRKLDMHEIEAANAMKSNADASLVNKRRDDHIFQDKVVYVMEKETRMLQQIKELVSRYIR